MYALDSNNWNWTLKNHETGVLVKGNTPENLAGSAVSLLRDLELLLKCPDQFEAVQLGYFCR